MWFEKSGLRSVRRWTKSRSPVTSKKHTSLACLDSLPHAESAASSVDLPVHLLVALLLPATEEALQDALNSVAGQKMAREALPRVALSAHPELMPASTYPGVRC